MRASLQFPLSGNVWQDLHPFSLMLRSIGQLGFININLGRAGNPDLEDKILERVGSYGRQLGRMADAVEVLLSTLDDGRLSEPQRRAIAAFQVQMDEIRKLKRIETGIDEPDLSQPAGNASRRRR